LKPLLDLLKAGKITPEREEGVLALVTALGGTAELDMVLDRALAGDKNSAARQANLLVALEQATLQRGVRPSGDLARLGKVLVAESEPLRASAARLAGIWKVEALRPQLLELARAANTSERLRQATIDGLGSLGGEMSRQALDELSAKEQTPAVRRMAIVALI